MVALHMYAECNETFFKKAQNLKLIKYNNIIAGKKEVKDFNKYV